MKNKQDYFNLLRKIEKDPSSSQRDLAEKLGFSLGKLNYCLKSLKNKGLIKINNFKNSPNKLNYLYILTPKGINEKTKLTISFMKIKFREYEELKRELYIKKFKIRIKKMNLKNKSILITGGTGSFGSALVSRLLKKEFSLKKLIIFSRDELKQEEMKSIFPEAKYKNLRYFIGDVRDYQRLLRAFDNVDVVIHAAALKQVPAAEYNPTEFVKTNVIGAQNVIEASIEKNVKKIVSLSTDKACAPINLYGASKLCSDKLFIAANNYSGKSIFSVVRYGNVMGSRGSVIPILLKQAGKNILNITDKEMTRFNITLNQAVDLVVFAIKNSFGSEILVPKIHSYKIMDLAKSIGPSCKINFIGVRPGEKIHEEMVSKSDSYSTYDIGKYYIILPTNNKNLINKYKKYKIKKVEKNFSYDSNSNKKFLNIKELRKLIKNNIDENFKPI